MPARKSSYQVSFPEGDICIDKDHVSYALAVLREHLTAEPASQSFQDVCCPGKPFEVNVTWEKARAEIAGNDGHTEADAFTPPERQCRGSSWGRDASLARAIRKAAIKHDPRFDKIVAQELAEIVCTVHLLQNVQQLTSADVWQPGEHGLMLTAPPHPLSRLTQKGPGEPIKVIYLKEVPQAVNWSLDDT
jgi:AMMECR1 domain-containing protein